MLRTDFPFPITRWYQRILAFLMGEAFLGFLAIISAALTILPMLFVLKPPFDTLVETGQWLIVAIFAVEYCIASCFAPSRPEFIRNPWRIIDLVTIVVPLMSLVPGVSDLLRSSPALRLMRIIRIVTLGVRAGSVIVREEARSECKLSIGPAEIYRLNEKLHYLEQTKTTWEEFFSWMRTPGAQWYSVHNIDQQMAQEIASAAKIPSSFLESHFIGASYPHIESVGNCVALFLWIPELTSGLSKGRNGLLILAMGNGLLTLSHKPTQLFDAIASMPQSGFLGQLPFSSRMVCALLQHVMNRNEELVGRFERELQTMEELPVRESRPKFFEQTFRLKKELSAVQSDLWRFKGILAALADNRIKIPGGGSGITDFFRGLSNDAEYLYETVVNTREGLLSLIELHLNVVSFDMNRVMRVLAVVSVLGLIPGIVGGLFGMNLSDTPWPFTLPQIAYAIVFGMVICLYLFFIKGWLR